MLNYISPHADLIQISDPIEKLKTIARSYSEIEPIPDNTQILLRQIVSSGKTSLLEHIVFMFDVTYFDQRERYHFMSGNPFVRMSRNWDRVLVSANLRTINEHDDYGTCALRKVLRDSMPELVYGSNKSYANTFGIKIVDADINLPERRFDPEEYEKQKCFTAHFVTSLSTAQAFARHRICSVTIDNRIDPFAIILPANSQAQSEEVKAAYEAAFENAARSYVQLVELGQVPKDVAVVLSPATKTDVVVTTNMGTWNMLFERYLYPDVAPDMNIKLLLEQVYEEIGKDPYIAWSRQLGQK